jgi:hypothetical protein
MIMTDRTVRPDALQGAIVDARMVERGAELVVRLQNTADRALHYIADVRGLRFDPATRTVYVRLTDEGRVLAPGVAEILPEIRYIDPGSEAELQVRLPETIVKLAEPQAGEPRRLAFEKHRIADAEEIVLEIAWADTPLYLDPRPTTDPRLPAVRWQQQTLTISAPGPARGGGAPAPPGDPRPC